MQERLCHYTGLIYSEIKPLKGNNFPTDKVNSQANAACQMRITSTFNVMSLQNKPEQDDFYYSPEGYIVFTEKYLLKRGYCCQNGCKHCPYGFNKKTGRFDREKKNDQPTK